MITEYAQLNDKKVKLPKVFVPAMPDFQELGERLGRGTHSCSECKKELIRVRVNRLNVMIKYMVRTVFTNEKNVYCAKCGMKKGLSEYIRRIGGWKGTSA